MNTFNVSVLSKIPTLVLNASMQYKPVLKKNALNNKLKQQCISNLKNTGNQSMKTCKEKKQQKIPVIKSQIMFPVID